MNTLTLHRSAGMTAWRQIAETLRTDITGKREAGDWLLPEGELAQRFGVNRHTLRRAIDALVAEGLVERRHGRGVQVLRTSIVYGIDRNTRFTELLTRAGQETASTVISSKLVPAEGGVARRLRLEEGASVAWVETLREVESQPFCVISHFLPAPFAAPALAEYREGSLHGFLKRRFSVEVERSESLITVRMPDVADARLLLMSQLTPILRVKSVNVDAATQEPVEYAVTRFRGDRIELSVDLSLASAEARSGR
jgi:GntR family transcriptional regulator, phosphonate transport system regulatory protein